MNNKHDIMREMDNAIDQMDMDTVERCLKALSSIETKPIAAEEPKLFAARILKLSKECKPMKQSRRISRLAIAAAVAVLLSITVYAASSLNLFSFQSGEKFVTMTTNQDMTEKEAKDMVSESPAETPSEEQTVKPTEHVFSSVEEAQSEMDMTLVLPKAMPEMKQDSIKASSYELGEGVESRTVWMEFSDDKGRALAITTLREVVPEGMPYTSFTTHDMDEGSLSSYKSKSGVEYTVLTESDDSGEKTAHIATTQIGEYEYALVFFGFDEAERQQIIDSADLTPYQK